MEECYDYDADIDELFLLAAKIICPAGQEEVLVLLTSIMVTVKCSSYKQLYNFLKRFGCRLKPGVSCF